MPTILVIDDNVQLLTMVRTSLVKQGYTVITASDATEGLEKVEVESPDLVITDLAMPGKDGFIFIQELRSRGFDFPIIATSGGMGTSVTDFLEAAREAGATDTLAKPFRVTDLVAKITQLLPATS